MSVQPADGWDQIGPLLRPGERLLWSGRPDPARNLTGKDAFLIPFSLLWGGFAVFWEVGVIRAEASVVMAVFGMVFVLLGLYFILGRFIVKRHQKAATRYFITTERALALRGSHSVRDTPVKGQAVGITRSRDGRFANVTFGHASGGWPFAADTAMYDNTGLDIFSQGRSPFSFFDVSNPGPMLNALEEARGDAPQDAAR